MSTGRIERNSHRALHHTQHVQHIGPAQPSHSPAQAGSALTAAAPAPPQDSFGQAQIEPHSNHRSATPSPSANREQLRTAHRSRQRSSAGASRHAETRTSTDRQASAHRPATAAGAQGAAPVQASNLTPSQANIRPDFIQERIDSTQPERFPDLLSRLASLAPTRDNAALQANYLRAIETRLTDRALATSLPNELNDRIAQATSQVYRSNPTAIGSEMDRLTRLSNDNRELVRHLQLEDPRLASNSIRHLYEGGNPAGGPSPVGFPEALRLIGREITATNANEQRVSMSSNTLQALSQTVRREWDSGNAGQERVRGLMESARGLQGPGASEARAMVACAVGELINEHLAVPTRGPVIHDDIRRSQMDQMVGRLAGLVQSDGPGIYHHLNGLDMVGTGRGGERGIRLNQALARGPQGQAVLGNTLGQLTVRAMLAQTQNESLSPEARRTSARDAGYFTGAAIQGIRNSTDDVRAQVEAQRTLLNGISYGVGVITTAPIPGGRYISRAVQVAVDELNRESQGELADVQQQARALSRGLLDTPRSALRQLNGNAFEDPLRAVPERATPGLDSAANQFSEPYSSRLNQVVSDQTLRL